MIQLKSTISDKLYISNIQTKGAIADAKKDIENNNTIHKLMLGENTKILVRPSGTEPLLRIYFETNEQEKLENLKNLVKILTKN